MQLFHFLGKKRVIILIFLVAFLVRVVYLKADPSILLDSGQVGDEGFWVYNARNLALFGQIAKDEFLHDLAAAPLYSFFSYISFNIFGVGFWQARLVSALSGLISVIFTYKIAGFFGQKVAIVSSALVSFNVLFLLHNRLAVPESLAIMFLITCVYFWMQKNYFLSGVLLAFSLMSKTTLFLFVPSITLIVLVTFLRDRKIRPVFLFSLSTTVTIAFIVGIVFLSWGEAVSRIYTTFGQWYKPRSLYDVWTNVLNFVGHPFWGSPFIFSVVFLAVANAVNFLLDKKNRDGQRLILILWMVGILFFAPFMSGISNARFLPLVVPISILAAQTLVNDKLLDLSYVSKFKRYGNEVKNVFLTLLLTIVPSVVASKIILAVLKRLFDKPDIVSVLPLLSITVWLVASALFIKTRKIVFNTLVKINVVFLLSASSIAFVDVFLGYLSFFGIFSVNSTTMISTMKSVLFILFFAYIATRKFDLQSLRLPAAAAFFASSILGVTTFLVNPSYNLYGASESIGQNTGDNALIGFYGHELSMENRAMPIYWAPRLESVSGINKNYLDYEPKFLLQTNVFDSTSVKEDAWPTAADIGKNTEHLKTLDLSRGFLGAEREFKVDLYKID